MQAAISFIYFQLVPILFHDVSTAEYCRILSFLGQVYKNLHRINTIGKLSISFIYLLQWQTCITIMLFHSSIHFNGFYTFTIQKKKKNKTMLFFFWPCWKQSSHFDTDAKSLFSIPTSHCYLLATLCNYGYQCCQQLKWFMRCFQL